MNFEYNTLIFFYLKKGVYGGIFISCFIVRLLVSAVVFLLALPWALFFRIKSNNKEDGDILLKNKRIFIGFNEISGNVQSIFFALQKGGAKCRSILILNRYYSISEPQSGQMIIQSKGIGYLFKINILIPLLFIRELFKNDVFLIIWNRTFLIFAIDAILLKIAGKRIVFMHCGDDVRYRPMQKSIDNASGLVTWENDNRSFLRFLNRIYFQTISEKCGEVISLKDQATFQKKPLYFFQFPQERLLLSAKPARDIPLILHCPSDPKVKGTEFVFAAIEKLKLNKIPFEFEIIQNKNNDYVLSRLKKADILIDQPGTWVARLAVEAMSLGCCVVGGNMKEYYSRYDSPVIQFEKDKDSLHSVLLNLIEDKKFRETKMSECFYFWEKNYSYESYIQFFENVLNGKATQFYALSKQKEILLSCTSSKLEKFFVRWRYL